MASQADSEPKPVDESPGVIAGILAEIVYSPVNLLLLAIITVLVFKIIRSRFAKVRVVVAAPTLKPLRRDMTARELRQYDGSQPDGRVLVAVNGWIFDCTRGKHFYGPGGPYAAFGGSDASRGFATFSITASTKEYDDLSDLNSKEMESVREWEAQFREKYDLVGKLLKPGEEPTNYSEEETDEQDPASIADKKQE